ncbi:MAG: CotH kinase family protein [Bacteroidota bacterium]
MHLTTEKKAAAPKSWLFPTALAGVVLLLLGLDWVWNKEQNTEQTATIYCDAEKVRDGRFVNGNFSFGGGDYQSGGQSRSGKYACRLTAEHRYGMQYEKVNPQPNGRYRVQVWRYATAGHQGFVAMEMRVDGKVIEQQQEGVAVEEEQGWERLELWFQLPENQLIDTLKVYTYIDERSATTFFDDLTIEYFPPNEKQNTNHFSPDYLKLQVEEKVYDKLSRQRWQAYKDGIILIDESEQWSRGQLYSEREEKEVPIELRLKGDWLDHLKGEKWSFRIKTKQQQAWNQMLTFSVQHPETRSYLSEWFYHQWLQKEGILAPRYDFLSLSLNGKSRGIFAVEEHFEKQLPELQQRREGPILKLSEDLLWLGLLEESTYLSKGHGLPEKEERAFEQSEIQTFKEKKTLSNPTLKKQFEEAQSLLHQFKYQKSNVADLFDTEKLARYYAITDLMQAYHGLTWHNMRFYFNPIINKLEPIGFDGFGTAATRFGGGEFIGEHLKIERHPSRFFTYLFENEDFFKQYLQYLKQFSEESYLEQLILDLKQATEERERYLQQEFPKYTFRTSKIIDRGRTLRRLMTPKNEYSLLVRSSENGQLHVSNRHAVPLEVVGYGNQKDEPTSNLEKPFFLHSTTVEDAPEWKELEIAIKPKYLFFRVSGFDEIYSSSVSAWSTPKIQTPTQLALQFNDLQSNSVYKVAENRVLFSEGKHTINQDILIPKGYEVYVEAGTILDFVEEAAFISKSTVYLMGTADNAIKIHSSDGTGNGFTILQAAARSSVNHVLFEGWNTLQKGNWQLTGGVTFYESNVDVAHCAFQRNHCEDALNFVRSEFTLSHSRIANTFSDGLDADFCKGTINKVRFEDTGNDASDFSDSAITIEDCVILRAGDKGISVGEAAKVYVKKAWIDGAVNGVASKDLSKLTIDDIMVKNCTNGFAAYQKKPEFGSASIVVKKYRQENVEHLYQIERGSSLVLEGKEVTNF